MTGREERERDMTQGYMDGFRDTRSHPPHGPNNRSEAYWFGWLNGRDDRLKSPRAPAATLRAEAERILRGDLPPRRRVGAAVAAALVLGGLLAGCDDVPDGPRVRGEMIGTVGGCEVWRVNPRYYSVFHFVKCPGDTTIYQPERVGKTEACIYTYRETL